MQGLRTLLILASFCFLETAASQAAAGALTGLSRGGTGAPVPDGAGPASGAGSHVTAETKAPLDSIVLTNQAGLSWALQNFDKGWALGTISLHGKPVEAQASNGMLILHNVITGEQRWIPLDLPARLRLVHRDRWERVQVRLKQNSAFSPRNEKHLYLLKGLVQCGGGGSRHVGESWRVGFFYRCSRRCKRLPAIRDTRLDYLVVSAVEHERFVRLRADNRGLRSGDGSLG